MIKHKFIGKRYDGGRSPLAVPIGEDSVMFAVTEPGKDHGGVLQRDQSRPIHTAAPGRWTKEAQADWEAIGAGRAPAAAGWANETLRRWGYDPNNIGKLSAGKRRKLQNRIRREIIRLQEEDRKLLHRQIELEATLSTVKGYVPGSTNETGLMDSEMRGALPRSFFKLEEGRKARTALHVRLRTWNAAPLSMERPQGSSLHHMLDYDYGNVAEDERRSASHAKWIEELSNCQIVLVENNWGAAVPPIAGEWRVPFAFMCWEFRISGVRVLAFTEADHSPPIMWMCYGADGHWVADDYHYELGCPELPRGIPFKANRRDIYELRRVAKMCYDTVRASCIMLDAQVARHEHVAAPAKLSERRAKEGRSPLRDHYVVRLLHEERRSFHRARSAGGSIGVARASQRGHWRKGTWVHYDDQDSGQVQYVNDGGFVVSKTWRRWHFAGDPKNIIHKEYRI